MQFLVFQHVRRETLGLLEAEAERHSLSLNYVRFWEGAIIPPLNNYQALIVLGGPMGANDEEKYPWLKGEITAIQEAVEGGIPILGLCLGAQLLARALGAVVTRNPVPEIGFATVELTPVGREDPLFRGFDNPLPVFQWHSDTFAIPQGAVWLASSPLCPHQAFRYGRNAYGLQFHLETTPGMIDRWVEKGAEDLRRAGVSAPRALVAQAWEREGQFREAARRLMENFLTCVAPRENR